jgi:hypothetical protein
MYVNMNELTKQINQANAVVMEQISAAAQRNDLSVLEHLTKKATELRAMADQITAIERRFESLVNGSHPSTVKHAPRGIREFVIEISQGMINQNLLTLTEQVKRGLIRVGEKLIVETIPSGDRFETELMPSGNKLQERGRIGRFYRDCGVRAGDVVLLTEITPGLWQLKKGDVVRYKRV